MLQEEETPAARLRNIPPPCVAFTLLAPPHGFSRQSLERLILGREGFGEGNPFECASKRVPLPKKVNFPVLLESITFL